MGKMNAVICVLATSLTVVACGSKSDSVSAAKALDASSVESSANHQALNEDSSGCKNRILFLPQTHPSILNGTLQVAPENLERTERSQFAIAKYLETHKSMPVFTEQASADQKVETVTDEFKKAAAQIKSMFPEGLPAKFEGLTDDQKNMIARAGGDAISFILRNTEMLHKVVENDQTEDQIIQKVTDFVKNNPKATTYSPEISNLIFNVRENLALDQINQFIQSNPSQKDVVLVFGAAHADSFKSHSDKFPPQCIVTPNEFQ